MTSDNAVDIAVDVAKNGVAGLTLQQKNQELEIAYQTIEQERQQWRALFEHALDAIAITDGEGNYVDANPAANQLFGAPREQLLQVSVADFTDPDVEFAQLWQQFLQQGQMKGEFRLYRPDGTQRDVEYAAVANFLPGRHLSVKIYRFYWRHSLFHTQHLETTKQI